MKRCGTLLTIRGRRPDNGAALLSNRLQARSKPSARNLTRTSPAGLGKAFVNLSSLILATVWLRWLSTILVQTLTTIRDFKSWRFESQPFANVRFKNLCLVVKELMYNSPTGAPAQFLYELTAWLMCDMKYVKIRNKNEQRGTISFSAYCRGVSSIWNDPISCSEPVFPRTSWFISFLSARALEHEKPLVLDSRAIFLPFIIMPEQNLNPPPPTPWGMIRNIIISKLNRWKSAVTAVDVDFFCWINKVWSKLLLWWISRKKSAVTLSVKIVNRRC